MSETPPYLTKLKYNIIRELNEFNEIDIESIAFKTSQNKISRHELISVFFCRRNVCMI